MQYCKDTKKCTWTPNSKEKDPHIHKARIPKQKILENILEAIGETPLIRLNKIPQAEGLKSEFLVKCEFLNPGGSIKDRIAYRMLDDAERIGRCKPGDTLIEPTSGNTGIGLSIAAAVKGYKMIVTLPEHNSIEKMDIMEGLGAEVVKTPAYTAHDSPESNLNIALRLHENISNSHILDQYSNPSNPLAHYDGTAEELIDQCEGKIDYLFMPAGTGGSLTGITRKFREKLPKCKVIGVDPVGSMLALPEALNGPLTPYKVEGIGYDFVPNVLDRHIIDEWVKVKDIDSFIMSRRLMKEEGMLVGGSAGTCLAAAIAYAKANNLGSNERIVVILPDSIRNYMTKFLSNEWMIANQFISIDEYQDPKHELNDIPFDKLDVEAVEFFDSRKLTIGEALDIFEKGAKVIPLIQHGEIIGVIWPHKLMSFIVNKTLKNTELASKAMMRDGYIIIRQNVNLVQVEKLLEKNHLLLIEKRKEGKEIENLFVVTPYHVLKILKERQKNH